MVYGKLTSACIMGAGKQDVYTGGIFPLCVGGGIPVCMWGIPFLHMGDSLCV